MVQKTSLAALVVGLLVASSFVGAAAFTSATVERDVSVGVKADDTAIIGLSPGTADAASLNGNGELVIQPDTKTFNNNNYGLNQNATFTYGDDTDAVTATTSQAFNITNNDNEAHTFILNYTRTQGSGTVTYAVAYDSNGDNSIDSSDTLTTFDNTTDASITLDSGETAYVVMTVDTGGGTNDIVGTLSIDA